jgi:hypothetical protein
MQERQSGKPSGAETVAHAEEAEERHEEQSDGARGQSCQLVLSTLQKFSRISVRTFHLLNVLILLKEDTIVG